jgi:hypothetical protein
VQNPDDRNARPIRAHLRSALRWLVAGSVGVAVSFSLFVMMVTAINGTDIVDRLFRYFPLIQVSVTVDDECAEGEPPPHLAVAIEGVIGYMRGDELKYLSDAVVRGENAVTGATEVDVSGDGTFRFIAAFPDNAPSACPAGAAVMKEKPQQLVIRASRCVDRRVPITAAWVPHTILLDCPDRD